ncbi:MAG: hypothetical protein AB8G11_18845 [Saprospiraceae bacterium]
MKKLHTFWQKLTYLGVGDDLSIEDIIKTRLLNIVLFIGISIVLLLCVRAVIVQEIGQMLIIFSMFLVLVGILLLNINNRQYIARLIIIFGVSLPMTATLIFLYPSPWELEFIYLMVIFVNLIFFQGRDQVIIVLFVASLFIAAHIIEPRLPMEYKVLIPLTPNLPLFLFIFFVLYSSITLTFYQSQIKKYQSDQKETIDALQKSNVTLKTASEELERFIYIVSSDLKNRLKKVQQQIKKVRKSVNEYQYENINEPLDKAENTARQMHFWVNDILEFSTVNQSGKRLEALISFDDLFTNIKNNVSEDFDFENRIIWTNIPDVRLNELEIFIVFHNVLKIALCTTDSKVRIVSILTNIGLNIQLICPKNGHSYHNEHFEKRHEKIKLCELIINGWNGTMSVNNKGNMIIYEIHIPKEKLANNIE